jgi:hypothetical protein
MFFANGFAPAVFPVGGVPAVETFGQAASPTFKKGYPVVATSGLIDECGAAPAKILGMALQDNSTNPGYALANNPTVITGQSTTASVSIANDSTVFVGYLVNNSSTIIAPTAADIGVAAGYGVAKYGSAWRVDKNLTGKVVITKIDTLNNFVYFKVMKGVQQLSV